MPHASAPEPKHRIRIVWKSPVASLTGDTTEREMLVDQVKTWTARGGEPVYPGGPIEHPDGVVVEGYIDGRGSVLQLDADDHVGKVLIEVD